MQSKRTESVLKDASTLERFYDKTGRSRSLYARALKVIAGGVNRTLLFHRPYSAYMERGRGAHIWDVDENERIDYCFNFMNLILGHAHPKVLKAISEQLEKGTAYGQPTELEIELAEKISEMAPCAERVKFAVSGTEAVMNAIRAARTYTRRKKILLFEGAYNGSSDAAIGRGTSYSSEGILEESLNASMVIPFNNQGALEEAMKSQGEQLAAVVLEPLLGSGGCIPPSREFLNLARELTEKRGALLIFDEIITGFRLAPGGAQQVFGVKPDLATYSKKIGGGLPAAAIVGTEEIMERAFAYPESPSPEITKPRIPLSGTYSANPLAMAAGIATLKELTSAAYENLNLTGESIRQGLIRIAREMGINIRVTGMGSLFDIFFHKKAVNSYADIKYTDGRARWYLDLELMNRGVYLSPRHVCCTSAVTTKSDVDTTLRIFEACLHSIKAVLKEMSPASLTNQQ